MSDTKLDISIRGGLPYSRRFRVVDGKNVWPTLEHFQVKGQVRVGPNVRATLKSDLTPYLERSYDVNDIIIDLQMSGVETRNLRGGFYDIVLHDPFDVDARAIVLVSGILEVTPIVTEVDYSGGT